MNPLTVERIREMLSYDPATGVLTWKVRLSNRVRIGDVAGGLDKRGYTVIGIGGNQHKAHRLAFAIMTGRLPEDHIDHVNGKPSDNRFVNLREVNERVNQENKRLARRDSSTGLLGVVPKRGRYAAYIGTRGKNFYLGTYDTPEQAQARYIEAKRELHAGCTI